LPVPAGYVIQFSSDDDVFVAYHHDVPSVKTHGDSVMEAAKELNIALRLATRAMTEDGAILISEASGRFAG
jgi:predicted RNase H-like HicB family nuclease